MKKTIFGVIFSLVLLCCPFEQAFAASFSGQEVTAYTAPSGNYTYYGTVPSLYITAAVHPVTCGVGSSGTVLARGTQIITSQNLSFPDGRLRNHFSVYDQGDVQCNRGLTRYFFDVYFGVKNTTNDSIANNFYYSSISYTTS
jgi:hypothetical protein